MAGPRRWRLVHLAPLAAAYGSMRPPSWNTAPSRTVELGSMRGKKAGEKKRFRAGHTKEARVENPAETSAPDPERANEMLVLRCPPRLWQASDLWVLGLQPGSRNGQIEDRPKNGPATHGCAQRPQSPRRPVARPSLPAPAPFLPTRQSRCIPDEIFAGLKDSTGSGRITV